MDDARTPSEPKLARCPICGKEAAARHRPFCSARCADIDLGRWLKGVYRVPTDEAPGEGETDGSGA
jgi:uncharacterized protein